MKIVIKCIIRSIEYLLYFFSFLVIRKKTIWLFGCASGYSGNSKFLYEYFLECDNSGIETIWITKDKNVKEHISSIGGKVYEQWSIKGLYYCLRGKVYIYSSYVSDINFFTSGGTLKVNLWHGVPFKKIEYDINTEPLVKIYKNATLVQRLRSPSHHVKADLVLAPTKYIAEYSFVSAFRLAGLDDIIVNCYPRNIPLLIEKNKKVNGEKAIFLYAPTWRDSGGDFIKESGIDFYDLDRFLSEINSEFHMRLHPLTRLDFDFSNLSNIKLIKEDVDATESMINSTVLITDYSSIYFDYLYLDRPIIFFCFDKDSYLSEREMYLDYDSSTPGIKVNNYSEMKLALNCVLNNDLFLVDRANAYNKFCLCDSYGYDNITQAVLRKLSD